MNHFILQIEFWEIGVNSFMTETDLQNKSVDWSLYDRDLRHE